MPDEDGFDNNENWNIIERSDDSYIYLSEKGKERLAQYSDIELQAFVIACRAIGDESPLYYEDPFVRATIDMGVLAYLGLSERGYTQEKLTEMFPPDPKNYRS